MTNPQNPLTTRFPSEDGRCCCCEGIGPIQYVDEQGHGFCSPRCYAAFCENLDAYIELSREHRHQFEKRDYELQYIATHPDARSPWFDLAEALARLSSAGPDLWRRR